MRQTKRGFIGIFFFTLLIAQCWAQDGSLREGDVVPDFTLTNQRGERVSLSDFKGRGIILSFLYTKCPYPDKCAMVGKKLTSLAKLSKKIGRDKELQVIAITIDPANDSPEVLRQYAQGFDQEHENWSFLTGSEDEIARVAGAFGVIYWSENGVIEHNLRTAFLDKSGTLRRLKSGSDWKAGTFAAEVEKYFK